MATSDPELARRVLNVLERSGIRFVVLHREDAIAGGDLHSDIDLAVDRNPRQVVATTWDHMVAAGLRPIAMFPYEVRELTVFYATADAQDGVQVDLLGDPRGQSVYGLRTSLVIDSAHRGRRWAVPSPVDELLFLLRKRQYKGQDEVIEELRTRARQLPRAELQRRASMVLSPHVRRSVNALIDRGLTASPYRPSIAYLARSNARRWWRVVHPAGFWVEMVGSAPPHSLSELASRFSRYLVSVRVSERPSAPSEQMQWWIAEVAPVRWRPGLLLSWASRPGWPKADLTLDGLGTSDDIARVVVDAMTERTHRAISP